MKVKMKVNEQVNKNRWIRILENKKNNHVKKQIKFNRYRSKGKINQIRNLSKWVETVIEYMKYD